MFEKIQSFISDYLGIESEQIMPESNLLKDFEISSYQAMEMFAEIEEAFNIYIDDSDIIHLVTINDLIEYISNKHCEP